MASYWPQSSVRHPGAINTRSEHFSILLVLAEDINIDILLSRCNGLLSIQRVSHCIFIFSINRRFRLRIETKQRPWGDFFFTKYGRIKIIQKLLLKWRVFSTVFLITVNCQMLTRQLLKTGDWGPGNNTFNYWTC